MPPGIIAHRHTHAHRIALGPGSPLLGRTRRGPVLGLFLRFGRLQNRPGYRRHERIARAGLAHVLRSPGPTSDRSLPWRGRNPRVSTGRNRRAEWAWPSPGCATAGIMPSPMGPGAIPGPMPGPAMAGPCRRHAGLLSGGRGLIQLRRLLDQVWSLGRLNRLRRIVATAGRGQRHDAHNSHDQPRRQRPGLLFDQYASRGLIFPFSVQIDHRMTSRIERTRHLSGHSLSAFQYGRFRRKIHLVSHFAAADRPRARFGGRNHTNEGQVSAGGRWAGNR